MKLLPTDKSNRILWVTGLQTLTERDRPNLEIQVTYTGAGNCAKAIPLDGQVIPQIKRAVNSFDELLAACEYARSFYQRYFDIMPVAFQGVDNMLETAILNATKKEER